MRFRFLAAALIIMTTQCSPSESIKDQNKRLINEKIEISQQLDTTRQQLNECKNSRNQGADFANKYITLVAEITKELNDIENTIDMSNPNGPGRPQEPLTFLTEQSINHTTTNIVTDLSHTFNKIRRDRASLIAKIDQLQNEIYYIEKRSNTEATELRSLLSQLNQTRIRQDNKIKQLEESSKELAKENTKLKNSNSTLVTNNRHLRNSNRQLKTSNDAYKEKIKCKIAVFSKRKIKRLRKNGAFDGWKPLIIKHDALYNPNTLGFKDCDCESFDIDTGVGGDKPSIRTPHKDNNAYFVKINRTWHLKIQNPNSFWESSRWLIIRHPYGEP